MNYFYEPKEQERVLEARESFSGRLLTNAQFDEAIAITGIVEREIKKSGSFKEKLGDYAYAFARTEQFDAMKAETVIRDLFKVRTGQTMNEMREEYAKREENLPDPDRRLGLEYARAVGTMIEEGTRINFNRAFAHQAQELAGELKITDAGAKRLMKEEFAAAEKRELYDWGKDLEDKHYRPQIEADKKKAEERSRDEGRDRGTGRDRGNGDGRDNDRSARSDRSNSRGYSRGGSDQD